MASMPRTGATQSGIMWPSFWRLLALGTVLACAVGGCSPEVAFPAIHDMPPPRTDSPLTPDQVKQATDDLVSERNHLSSETQAAAAAAAAADAPPTTATATPPAKKKKKKVVPAAAQAAQQQQAAAAVSAPADGSKP
jgi:hypothetical protein